MENIKTPEQFATEMQQIKNEHGNDYEAAHGYMDDLICAMLKQLGYAKGIEIFEQQEKWYA